MVWLPHFRVVGAVVQRPYSILGRCWRWTFFSCLKTTFSCPKFTPWSFWCPKIWLLLEMLSPLSFHPTRSSTGQTYSAATATRPMHSRVHLVAPPSPLGQLRGAGTVVAPSPGPPPPFFLSSAGNPPDTPNRQVSDSRHQ